MHSQVLDLVGENISCQELNNAPYGLHGGTGGFVQNEVLVCGGYISDEYFDNCWILNKEESFNNMFIPMNYPRYGTASIVINDKVSLSYSLLQGRRNLWSEQVKPVKHVLHWKSEAV